MPPRPPCGSTAMAARGAECWTRHADDSAAPLLVSLSWRVLCCSCRCPGASCAGGTAARHALSIQRPDRVCRRSTPVGCVRALQVLMYGPGKTGCRPVRDERREITHGGLSTRGKLDGRPVARQDRLSTRGELEKGVSPRRHDKMGSRRVSGARGALRAAGTAPTLPQALSAPRAAGTSPTLRHGDDGAAPHPAARARLISPALPTRKDTPLARVADGACESLQTGPRCRRRPLRVSTLG